MSLIKKIKNYYKEEKSLLFTTPSHSQGDFIPDEADDILGEKFYKSDFSEIEGFDNLRNPNGVIKDLQEKIAQIYGAQSSFILTNGSTSGILAAMLAVLKPNDRVLIARNCHVSVYNGLVLTGAVPVWFVPDFDKDWLIYKGIEAYKIEELLHKNKNIKALILTSPTYEGIFTDIEAIAAVCRKYDTKLIVDEAHGALLNFGDFKTKPAVLSGADISVQSLHKTAGAPNPCALLHLSDESDIPPSQIQNALNIINTTSPSYPLMCAIEACVNFLSSVEGKNKVRDLLHTIEDFKRELTESISFYEGFNDPSKLLISVKNKDAEFISDILNNDYKIEEEFSTSAAMLFITGIGTSKSKLEKLAHALKDIITKYDIPDKEKDTQMLKLSMPEMKYLPREAYFKKKKCVQKNFALNQISGECIMKYPPGIPLILPGEIINENLLNQCSKESINICED